jgi:hypothetical protein
MSDDNADLTSLMDDAMRTMLREIAKPSSDIATADKVKVLAAATNWAALKLKIPPPKGESKFATLQRRLEPRKRSAGGGGGSGEDGEGQA